MKPIIQVDNVKCKITGINAEISRVLSKDLSVQVPNYWFSSSFKSGRWDGYFKFFLRPSNTFPTGLLPRVVRILKNEFNVVPEVIDNRNDVNKYLLKKVMGDYKISDTKTARDYQVETVNKLIDNNVLGISFPRGIVNLATGAGKTSIAIMVIKELYPKLVKNKTNFLFVTHSKEIANQAKKSIEEDAGIEVGFIGDGKWELKPVTVAIVTTLYRRMGKPEFKELTKRVIGFVADECHHSSSTSWYDVFSHLSNALIRIGLTGTVDKSKPVEEMKLYACTGEIIKKVSNDYLINQGFSAKPVCIWFKITEPNVVNKEYHEAYELGIVKSKERLKAIKSICEKETKDKKVVLILVEHVEHGQLIESALSNLKAKVVFTYGTLPSERREQILADLKAGSIDVLISTSILDEGVDVAGINAVIYARGMKSTRKLLQGLGRGIRKKKDGSELRYYDFIDATNEKLLLHSKSRLEVLENEKFLNKLLTLEQYISATWEEIRKPTK